MIETEDVVALQPCPFCGSADIETISSRLWNDDPDRPERFWVECLSCGAEPYQPSEDQAEIIAAWNARSATPIERLREENARLQADAELGRKFRLGQLPFQQPTGPCGQ